MPWEPTRFPGVFQKTLYKEDVEDGALTLLMKFEPGSRLPRHAHTEVEQTFVLEGSLVDHEGACTPGNYVWRDADSVHEAWSPDGALLIAVFRKPNKFF